MKLRRLCKDFFVAGEFELGDIDLLRQRGIRSIVNNLAVGELDQPTARMRAAVTGKGLAYAHVPISDRLVDENELAAFAEATADLPKPICAFCDTGFRSMVCWALSELGRQSTYSIVEAVEGADFGSEGVRRQMGVMLNHWPDGGQPAYG